MKLTIAVSGQRGAEKMYNPSRSNQVISKGYEEPMGRKCMDVLARPAPRARSAKGRFTVWAVTVTH